MVVLSIVRRNHLEVLNFKLVRGTEQWLIRSCWGIITSLFLLVTINSEAHEVPYRYAKPSWV